MKKSNKEIVELAQKCHYSLRNNEIEEALNITVKLRESYENGKFTILEKYDVALIFIDVGSYIHNRKMIELGHNLIRENYIKLKQYFKKKTSDKIELISTFEYNFANSFFALYNHDKYFSRNALERIIFNPESVEILLKAKSHFWAAIKAAGKNIKPQYYVNLANSLDQSGRNREALIWYDKALSIDNKFSKALINKGLALEYFAELSNENTIKLLDTARNCYFSAAINGQDERDIEYSFKKVSAINHFLKNLGFDDDKIQNYNQVHKEEYKDHSNYWKWCLSSNLVLSEHSLYCKCVGSGKDDLSIITTRNVFDLEDRDIEQENLLNHIKSEYYFARSLLYQSVGYKYSYKTYNGVFTDLNDGTNHNIKIEYLRNSFRLCFGILDKIARGICNQFELADPNENIYFHNFWQPKNEIECGCEKRWKKINDIKDNVGLVALYSFAKDLEFDTGEWDFYKNYRNTLEHGLFIIKDDEFNDELINERNLKTVKYSDFKTHTLQMLQFTAAAIFSFVFCVRREIKKREKEIMDDYRKSIY